MSEGVNEVKINIITVLRELSTVIEHLLEKKIKKVIIILI